MVCLEAQSIRADIVPEIVSLPHGIAQVKVELFFLTGAEEIVKDTQTLLIIQRTRTALQPAEVLAKVGIDPMEEGAGLLDALPCNGHGDVLILDQVIALGCLVGHDPVVLSAVAIQIIPTLPHQNIALKVRAIQPPVVDGDLRSGVCGQTVQHTAVSREHIPLILMGGQRVVDVRKPPCAAVFTAAHLPDSVPIDLLNGDGLLDAVGDAEVFPLTAVCGKECLNHKCLSPFCSLLCSTDFQSGTPAALHTRPAT